MSVLDIPLRKLIQLFYADKALRRRILKNDVRLDRVKENGGNRSSGGDFFLPFWADVKKHVSGDGDISDHVALRIASEKRRKRLYEKLRVGVLELLSNKLRWTNEPIQIVGSAHGNFKVESIGAVVRVRDALHARIGTGYERIVYPYFSESPILSEDGGRLALWAMQKCLPNVVSGDIRIIDIIRSNVFSIQSHPFDGDEEEIFMERYNSVISEWDDIRSEYE